jgi:hypothetical protein
MAASNETWELWNELGDVLSRVRSLLRGATYCIEKEPDEDAGLDLLYMAENLVDDAKALASRMYKSTRKDAPGSDQTAGESEG